MKYIKIILTICFIISAVFVANAQEPSEKKTEKSLVYKLVNETVKREGWTSPIFADQISKVASKKSLMVEGIKIQTKFHKFTKRQYFSLVESCDIKRDELDLAHNEWDYALEGFTTYEIKGKVFAYQAPFQFIEAETSYEVGAGILPIYVDEEGNGKFKLRCDDNTELESLPGWIKTQVTK